MNLDPATGLLAAGRIKTAVPKVNAYVSPVDGNGPGAPAVTPTLPTTGIDTQPTSDPLAKVGASAPGDLLSQIQNDPLYKQAQADIAAARVSDLASLTGGRQRAISLFGAVPDFSSVSGALGLVGGDIGGDITDTVRQLAQQNTRAGLSTTAKIGQANDDQVKAIKDALTARGLLSSGETGYQLGRQDLAFRQANNDALQQLLDLLAGYNSSYLTAEQARRQTLAQQAAAAAGRIPPPAAGAAVGDGSTPSAPANTYAPPGATPAGGSPYSGVVQAGGLTFYPDGTIRVKGQPGYVPSLY